MTLFRIVFSLLLSASVTFTYPVMASELNIKVVDLQQLSIADAVVELIPAVTPTQVADIQHYQMSQKDRTFVPFVLAVPKGAKVDFPNLDRTRHHVYSFSETKPFELKLYVGQAEAPILFDKSGLVALGCNIHDYMQAFIYVADSPLVAVANDKGEIQFNDLAVGQYKVKLWHPWQKMATEPTDLLITQGHNSLSLSLDIERQAKPSAPPAGFGHFDAEGNALHVK
ncbi:methylamine utilization protein [Shewanella glacialipiscicola]|uniref:Methylamine utilization protein n=1 Tax=Shewanella glacialipiscicola TaxID=614069 RepID=A0ABQ6J0A4_9GAMM|nr:methylamine utilization protein [Shewanella glacialipiscicola]MCL1086212.1 methylamine utilization protein [Shewanella glacialipiscicola]GIU08776.1 methylamine utilization protein [Shewanella glacialipiscicola]GMA81149.1 methylamine utilization protein [Shewanella glacialipiscicola]